MTERTSRVQGARRATVLRYGGSLWVNGYWPDTVLSIEVRPVRRSRGRVVVVGSPADGRQSEPLDLGDAIGPEAFAHALAWGVTAMYLLVAFQFTSQIMRWLPRRLWRAVHLMSFPLFAMATVHTAIAGTDAGHPLMIFTAVALSIFIVLLIGLRATFSRMDHAPKATAASD